MIGISCCSKTFGPGGVPNYAASDFCVRAAAGLSGALPVLLPACGDLLQADALLDRLDGILLTGSRSDVEPALYGCTPREGDRWSDPGRDATTLPLIRAAIQRGTPILAICRGLQELNVALGGTLHQDLAAIGRPNHDAASPEDPVGRVAPAHWVVLAEGGRLSTYGRNEREKVNSLHRQAIDRLAPGLRVEATAPDGTIEAVSHASAGFVLGVQWHPEFDAATNAFSAAIFRAFGAALHRQETGERLAAD